MAVAPVCNEFRVFNKRPTVRSVSVSGIFSNSDKDNRRLEAVRADYEGAPHWRTDCPAYCRDHPRPISNKEPGSGRKIDNGLCIPKIMIAAPFEKGLV
jgi:hypothetical protein